LARRTRLDLYRKPRHRARSRFLHLMAYLDSGLARHQEQRRRHDALQQRRQLRLLLQPEQFAAAPEVQQA
ncbi:hypothetical protein R0G64_32895, partial [Pseudomonas otitidis]